MPAVTRIDKRMSENEIPRSGIIIGTPGNRYPIMKAAAKCPINI